MTLGVLPKYRELGLGALMLKHVLKICEDDGNIDSIYLYVMYKIRFFLFLIYVFFDTFR